MRGEYNIIHDVVEYALDIQEEVINQIQSKLNIAVYALQLNKLKTHVKRLIDDYKIDYLGDLFFKIENKLADIIKQEENKRQIIIIEDAYRIIKRKEEDKTRKYDANPDHTTYLSYMTSLAACSYCEKSTMIQEAFKYCDDTSLWKKPTCIECIIAHGEIYELPLDKNITSIDRVDGANIVITKQY